MAVAHLFLYMELTPVVPRHVLHVFCVEFSLCHGRDEVCVVCGL